MKMNILPYDPEIKDSKFEYEFQEMQHCLIQAHWNARRFYDKGIMKPGITSRSELNKIQKFIKEIKSDILLHHKQLKASKKPSLVKKPKPPTW